MKTTLASLLALVLGGGALAATSPLAPLARLEGHCWQGEFAEGGSWDRHCFVWAYDGQFLRDTHVVTGKRGPYGGETLYRFDEDRYVAVTEQSRDGRWVEAWRVVYSKQAP